eukprot:3567447-Prymnesium_polylepis.1
MCAQRSLDRAVPIEVSVIGDRDCTQVDRAQTTQLTGLPQDTPHPSTMRRRADRSFHRSSTSPGPSPYSMKPHRSSKPSYSAPSRAASASLFSPPSVAAASAPCASLVSDNSASSDRLASRLALSLASIRAAVAATRSSDTGASLPPGGGSVASAVASPSGVATPRLASGGVAARPPP